ncbi:MAG: hypothetical protein JXA90_17235, partial [Planctomycetes bacterium]|nr:hypothetical protein [Planctomycetota bacterium]
MGLLKKLFSSRKVTAREIRMALRSAERDRDRRLAGLRKLEDRRGRLFLEIKGARSRGDRLEVDRLWDDLRAAKVEAALEQKESRISQLEVIALKRAARALERMEARKDRSGVEMLVRRLRNSGLDEKLMAQEIRDEEYIRELDG